MSHFADLRAMSVEDLQAQILERKKSLFNLRLRHANKELENSAQLRATRRDIATIATILREKQLASKAK